MILDKICKKSGRKESFSSPISNIDSVILHATLMYFFTSIFYSFIFRLVHLFSFFYFSFTIFLSLYFSYFELRILFSAISVAVTAQSKSSAAALPATPAASLLPQGWIQMRDPTTSRTYYVNQVRTAI